MNKFNIKEESLPDNIKVFNKDTILSFLKQSNNNLQKEKIANKMDETSKIKNDDNKTGLDYVKFKNVLSHSYYSNCANIDKLLSHINNINKTHKKTIGIEDFIVKVIMDLIFVI